MRKLSPVEEKRLAVLTAKSVEACLIEPTKTGLGKAILDATDPVRRHLTEKSIHDYSTQGLGAKEHGIQVKAHMLSEGLVIPSVASLYRPKTKKGDPRVWFKSLPSYAKTNDILALIIHDDEIYVLNLTQLPLVEIVEQRRTGPICELLNEVSQGARIISDELLLKIKQIAQSGPARSVTEMKADTAIGRTLETMLGIEINSRKEPDYKGIELKSYRAQRKGRENRKNLFAQVPNWELSKFKSSKEILNNFGYDRDGDFKLYCTVSTKVKNSQGLQLELNQKADQLLESSDDRDIGVFATWLMDDLRTRLLEKHNETFWVAADSESIDGQEYFQFTNVLHTRKPIATQFDILVEQGAITIDHLIKRTLTGGAKEKGPLFKIESAALEMLFPPSKSYELLH